MNHTRYVAYHSLEWQVLVETGWVPTVVEQGIARMLFVGRR